MPGLTDRDRRFLDQCTDREAENLLGRKVCAELADIVDGRWEFTGCDYTCVIGYWEYEVTLLSGGWVAFLRRRKDGVLLEGPGNHETPTDALTALSDLLDELGER